MRNWLKITKNLHMILPLKSGDLQTPIDLSLCSHWPIGCNFRYVIFKHILVIDIFAIYCKIALSWISQDVIHDKLASFQVMVWCYFLWEQNLNGSLTCNYLYYPTFVQRSIFMLGFWHCSLLWALSWAKTFKSFYNFICNESWSFFF